MSSLLHRRMHHPYPVAMRGEGLHIIDSTGNRYLDASGGAAVSCLGHQHPRVLSAIREQLDRLAYAHTGFFTSDSAEALGDELVEHAPPSISHACLVSGGSEAVEAALKLARQYYCEIGQPQRRNFIARRQSYHGATLGALAVGGSAKRRDAFAPIMAEGHLIDPCYAYRYQQEDESDEAYGLRAAADLERMILALGPETVIGFVVETVAGASLGAVPPAPGYFSEIRRICDRHGILLILDEVMCGLGRTGTLYACEQEGVEPDLVCVAKGLAGGYMPIGATLLGRHVHDALSQGSAAFLHGHTYMGHPLACAAALAVQETIREDGLLDNVRTGGRHLQRALQSAFADHPFVGDIRGRGLFWGVELVAERAGKSPFPAAMKMHERVKAEAMARGLMVYPMGGTADGRSGDHVLLAPPFNVDPESIDAIVLRLAEAVDAATLRFTCRASFD
jgi:adenosylmethionine-8-amino-7-oxononanoate aminotransferase